MTRPDESAFEWSGVHPSEVETPESVRCGETRQAVRRREIHPKRCSAGPLRKFQVQCRSVEEINSDRVETTQIVLLYILFSSSWRMEQNSTFSFTYRILKMILCP